MPKAKQLTVNGRKMVDSRQMREGLERKYGLQYCDQYLRTLARAGKIPGIFQRRAWYFNIDEVAQALGVAVLPAKNKEKPLRICTQCGGVETLTIHGAGVEFTDFAKNAQVHMDCISAWYAKQDAEDDEDWI